MCENYEYLQQQIDDAVELEQRAKRMSPAKRDTLNSRVKVSRQFLESLTTDEARMNSANQEWAQTLIDRLQSSIDAAHYAISYVGD